MKSETKIMVFLLMVFLAIYVYAMAAPVPDTGQIQSYTDTFGEDSDYLINPPSYTKLDAQGNDLPDSATSWTMVRDNVTGLIWEVKTDDGSVHDKDNTYTWYDSNPDTNGGNAGTPGDGTDTEDFINALNNSNYGSHSDWRLPTPEELQSIVYFDQHAPAINDNYFPNTVSYFYWSSTTYAAIAATRGPCISTAAASTATISQILILCGPFEPDSLGHWIIWLLTTTILLLIPIQV